MMAELPLDSWPSYREYQYDTLVLQPLEKAKWLKSDDNTPARVWREGRAQAMLLLGGTPGAPVKRPRKQLETAFPRGWTCGTNAV